MNNKPIFCAQAFGSISVNQSSEYISCCNIRPIDWDDMTLKDPSVKRLDPADRINAENLRKVRRELIEGTWPKVCENCRVAENNGVQSMRTIWNKELERFNIPAKEYIDPKDVTYLYFTFSTKCNSKCMTCNYYSSDFWEEEHEYIWKTPIHKIARISINDSQADKFIEQFPNVEHISFLGGEPTISDEHIRYLKKLIDLGRSDKIKISYVTNLTGITEDLIEIWDHFKQVQLTVSIDGYEKVNEYIRYPFKWDKVENTLRNIFKLAADSRGKYSTGLSCTVSMFNAVQCFDLLNFWFDLTTENIQASNTGCFVNYVSVPEYAVVSLLSPEYKQQGLDKGKQLLTKIADYETNNPNNPANDGLKDSIRLAMAWLEEPQIYNKEYLEKSKHFIEASDLFRKRHIKDYIPELWEELEKLWQNL